MISVHEQVEIAVHLNNETASVGKVMVAATAPNVEILASCFYWQRDGAVVRLVTEAPQRTAQALANAGFECETESILLIGPMKRPGVAAQMSVQLAGAEIGILYSYVSWSERTEAFAVFKTTDDDRALCVLQSNAGATDLAGEKTGRGPKTREMSQPVAARLVA